MDDLVSQSYIYQTPSTKRQSQYRCVRVTICTHVADIFNHCSKDRDGVGAWFDVPLSATGDTVLWHQE